MTLRHALVFMVFAMIPLGALADAEAVTADHGFIAGHPDMYWRAVGQEALADGKARDAFDHFRKAARYADKPSQAITAEMLWTGNGVAKDRAAAYAWIDLASERGYTKLIVVREKYWSELTPAERERAVTIGEDVYAEFGDSVAKPRMNAELQRARTRVTGSRLGHVGSLRTAKGSNAGGTHPVMDLASLVGVVDGRELYADKYWVPEQYWKWQDAMWK